MDRYTTTALGAVTLLTLPAGAMAQDETAWRVFVADHEAPTVTAFDLSAPDERWTFDVTGHAKLYPSPEGEAVVAVQSDHDAVHFIDSGIALTSHGDHSDIEIEEPSLMDATLEGPRPFHVVSHGDEVAINFDEGGYASMISASALASGAPEPVRFEQETAHHGFAASMGGMVVSSVADPEGEAPAPRIGIQAFEADGTAAGEMQTCTGLHGEAFSGEYLLAGCEEGVVAAQEADGAIAFEMLPYPESFPEGHTGTLLGARAMQAFLGDYGDEAVIVIDPSAEPHFQLVELPFRRVDFMLDPARPQHAYVLTEDGTLHRLDMLAAELEESAEIVDPYSMDGHWRDPRPRMTMAGDRILLTDPREGVVRVLDAASLEEEETIAIDGAPYNIVVVGGSGLTH